MVSERLWQEHQRLMREEGLDKDAAWKRLYDDEELMKRCHEVGPLENY